MIHPSQNNRNRIPIVLDFSNFFPQSFTSLTLKISDSNEVSLRKLSEKPATIFFYYNLSPTRMELKKKKLIAYPCTPF